LKSVFAILAWNAQCIAFVSYIMRFGMLEVRESVLLYSICSLNVFAYVFVSLPLFCSCCNCIFLLVFGFVFAAFSSSGYNILHLLSYVSEC
jgi:hypothetical protein